MSEREERQIVISNMDGIVILGYGFQDGDRSIPACSMCGGKCIESGGDRTYTPMIYGITCLFVFCSDKCQMDFEERKQKETFFESNMVLEIMSNALESMYDEWKETRDAKIESGMRKSTIPNDKRQSIH